MRLTPITCALASLLLAIAGASAKDDAADSAVHRLQSEWERIKFSIPEGPEQTTAMNTLGRDADATAKTFADQVGVQIWDGIITSERAGLASMFSALSLAKRARDILQRADKMDASALDAGAPASLGVLYYRVPGFPIGFGDKSKARRLLEEATRAAPNGLDAWYFYGDFLMSQGENAQATAAFKHALAIPKNAARPLWDTNRRLVIEEDLEKIKSKS